MSWLQDGLRKWKAYPALLRLKKIPFYARAYAGGANDKRSFCAAPWTETSVLCDGTVVCTCYDALKTMPLGTIQTQSFREIWEGTPYRRLRKAVLKNAEKVYLCSSCCFREECPCENELQETFPVVPEAFPKVLQVEPTVRCNLNCLACGNDLAKASRSITDLPFDVYTRLIDEVGPHVQQINFYDYGEAFLHPRAVDMIAYAKKVNPDVYIYCTTNGHFFQTREKQQAVIESGLDELIFSVDGASQETYARYRVNGRFDVVLKAMREMIALRNDLGRSTPAIKWRYILFTWNDSDEEMDKARQLAREIGVDKLGWLLTRSPEDGYSRRFLPGTPDFETIKDDLL